jgi:hypothetical protein
MSEATNPPLYHGASFLDALGQVQHRELGVPARYEIGNKRHWPAGITTEWQMRPFEPSDVADGCPVKPGERLVGRRYPGVASVFFKIRMPPHLRANTPRNVTVALIRLFRGRPDAVSLLAALEADAEEVAASVKTGKGETPTRKPQDATQPQQ